MSDDSDRYSRQIRLPEVGQAGQEKICRCAVEARGRDGALVELAYLERAGVGAVELRPLGTPVAFRHAAVFRFDATRRIAAGAWRALRTLERVLSDERLHAAERSVP
ncbi:MAG TPA: hypothetical protein VF395_20180 [Polyangiaceae bacterium]